MVENLFPHLLHYLLLSLLILHHTRRVDSQEVEGGPSGGVGLSRSKCPVACTCSYDTVHCYRILFRIPSDVPITTNKLYLSGSKITNLTRLNLPNIVSLSLANTGLTSIHYDAFAETHKLESLDLSYNELTKLSGEFFKNLKHLKVLQVNNNKVTCLDSSLQTLTNLEILNLQNNLLTSLPEGSLSSLNNLRQLRLENNKFHCSCQLEWLGGFLRRNSDLGIGTICHSPSSLEGRSVAAILPFQLNCQDTSEPPEHCAEIVFKCPHRCRCSKGVVDCRALGLRKLPDNIPYDTVELRLEKNLLENVPAEAFATAPNIKRIDLSRNRISSLDKAAFRPNKHLTTLILYDNQLETLPPQIFSGLNQVHMILLNKNKLSCLPSSLFRDQKKLVLLSLFDNDLETLPKGLLHPLKNVRTLHLGLNPWNCTCHLNWLSTYLAYRQVETSGAVCKAPDRLEGRLLSVVPRVSCQGEVVRQLEDNCYQECPQGCVCVGTTVDCSKGGVSSFPKLPRHTSTLILNNNRVLSCTITNRKFRCECMPGWEGEFCSSSVDECSNNRCRNGAECLDKHLQYECVCKPGYSGQYCHHREEQVEQVEPVCRDHLCQNEGVCLPGGGGTGSPPYTCSCQYPFTGRYCQDSPAISLMYQSTSPCSHHDCLHGECHDTAGQPGYTCHCHPGYSGKRCEYMTSIQLKDPNSYVELDPLYTVRPVNLTLVVQTEQSAGVILYHGDKDHIAVELFHGRIRASWNVGNNPASTMFSYALLNDNQAHSVNLVLDSKSLTLSVDGVAPRTIVNEGVMTHLVVQKPTYLGGIPSRVGEVALSNWHLRNSTSFNGCIKNFFIEEKQIDFLQAARVRRSVQAGCEQRHLGLTSSDIYIENIQQRENKEKKRKGCLSNKCRKTGTRKCISKKKKGYMCKCKRGYDGRYCEKAPSCRKRKEKVLLEENNCRARRLLAIHHCGGDCRDSTCCTAKKTKTKKVAMICNDGTRYVKIVTTARKCSCLKRRNCSRNG